MTAEERAVIVEVGSRLRAERHRQERSQAWVARSIGTFQTSVSEMELGNQNIPLPTYLSWCDALGVEPWELLGWR